MYSTSTFLGISTLAKPYFGCHLLWPFSTPALNEKHSQAELIYPYRIICLLSLARTRRLRLFVLKRCVQNLYVTSHVFSKASQFSFEDPVLIPLCRITSGRQRCSKFRSNPHHRTLRMMHKAVGGGAHL